MDMAADRAPAELARYREPAPFTAEAGGQSLTFYPAGEDRRAALFDLVRSAKFKLDVCFYIFAEDAVGTAMRDALADAAGRGVEVTLIVDRFGADASDAFLQPLVEAGGRFFYFNPRWTQRYLIRNHQKMVIADGERALFGGFNIEDSYFVAPQDNGWSDLAIELHGDAAGRLAHWFGILRSWVEGERPNSRAIRRAVREWERSSGDGRAVWLLGGPTRGLSSWARSVTRDLLHARRIDMLVAYFSPPYSLLRRIARVAKAGEARLVLASKSDNGATLGASRSLYKYLLKRGAKIWEFQPCKLHTKLIVLDDAVYAGSANFDMRSLYINLELMLRIEDAALAARMREFIGQHIAASEAITRELHRGRATLWNRFRWFLGWLLVAVIDYTVTRRLNLGL